MVYPDSPSAPRLDSKKLWANFQLEGKSVAEFYGLWWFMVDIWLVVGNMTFNWKVNKWLNSVVYDGLWWFMVDIWLVVWNMTFNWKVNHTESSDVPWVFSFPFFLAVKSSIFPPKNCAKAPLSWACLARPTRSSNCWEFWRCWFPKKKHVIPSWDSMEFNGIEMDLYMEFYGI